MARHRLASLLFWIISGLLFCIMRAGGASAQIASVAGCHAEGSAPATSLHMGEDGVIQLDGAQRLRLAGLLWPDVEEGETRRVLAHKLNSALSGQRITWRPAGEADRWGILPAHVFIAEPMGNLPPFWLQAGLVETGLTPAWPDLIEKTCWSRLQAHEAVARRAKRGYWAPRAQAARHRRMIGSAQASHQGRRIVALWRVSSVKPGRAVTFVNLGRGGRGAPSLWISHSQQQSFAKAGKDITHWTGKWILARFVLNEHGLRRIRLEAADHVDQLDENVHTISAQQP